MSKDTKCNNDFFRDFSYGIKVTAVVVHLAVLVVIDRIAEENTRRQKKKRTFTGKSNRRGKQSVFPTHSVCSLVLGKSRNDGDSDSTKHK
mmetsp:Transcript_23596/g.52477  ORF Transcript_23596/g.52477 Transcript_23596/m.52477 type:complete len:90 (+) Transcript_23596:171-440(+)